MDRETLINTERAMPAIIEDDVEDLPDEIEVHLTDNIEVINS